MSRIELKIPHFGGGLCTTPTELMDAYDLVNCRILRDNSLEGYGSINPIGTATISGTPLALHIGKVADTGYKILQTSSNVYYLYQGNWVSSGTASGGTTTRGSICQFENVFLIANESYSCLRCLETADNFLNSLGQTVSGIKAVATDKVYNYAATKNTLYYSEAGSYGSWPSDNILMDDQSMMIRDIKVQYGRLYIFTDRGIYQKTGLDEESFSIDKLNSDVVLSRVAQSPQGMYYLNYAGLMMFDGSNSKLVSNKVDSRNITFIDNDQPVFYSNNYRQCYIPTISSGNYCLLVYDVLLDRWWKYSVDDKLVLAMADNNIGSSQTFYIRITYTGVGSCDVGSLNNGAALNSHINGVSDPLFTKGATSGNIDLTNVDVDTFTELVNFIDGLANYTCTSTFTGSYNTFGALVNQDPASVNAGRSYYEDVGVEGEIFLAYSGGTRVYRGWYTNSAGKVQTKLDLLKETFRVLKRPRYIFLDGTSISGPLYLKYGTTTEQTWTSPSRVNYCTREGTPRDNFTIRVENFATMKGIEFVADAVKV